jgi:SPP1 gp7 family putative phage head morphogenesis protein|nr:MAG TPA: minor capsid protein [Caudoviricetes sp.]
MKKSRSNNYWEQREQKWIEQRIKNDNTYLNEMVKRYEELANSIQQQINGFYAKYASDTGLTMSEAVKKINSFDVKSFEETAAKMVAKKDFSQYANDRLKIYNATMKINRLEFLKAQLGLEITNATNKEELAFNDYLLKSYQDELKRQSGILGYHKNVDLKQSATTVVNASFHGATWSSRLWINQDVLKAKLDMLLSRAMIQGTNPKQMIASLRTNIAKEINNTTSVIENLVVTESARVQDVAQMESLKRNGFKFCKWIAEPTACKRCREIAESNNEHGIGVYRLDDVPMIPEHPRCRCSKAAYWVDEKKLSYTAKYLNVTPVKYQPDEKIPVKARPNSVSARYVEDKVVQYRLYNNEGYVLVDFDLTNHGNPKHHKVVPHKHEWTIIKSENGVKYKRSKDPNVPLTDEELELVKRWREYDN